MHSQCNECRVDCEINEPVSGGLCGSNGFSCCVSEGVLGIVVCSTVSGVSWMVSRGDRWCIGIFSDGVVWLKAILSVLRVGGEIGAEAVGQDARLVDGDEGSGVVDPHELGVREVVGEALGVGGGHELVFSCPDDEDRAGEGALLVGPSSCIRGPPRRCVSRRLIVCGLLSWSRCWRRLADCAEAVFGLRLIRTPTTPWDSRAPSQRWSARSRQRRGSLRALPIRCSGVRTPSPARS